MVLLFSFPLKYVCRLFEVPFLFTLVLSGLIAYINAKVYQNLNDRSKDVNIFEFIYIFFLV